MNVYEQLVNQVKAIDSNVNTDLCGSVYAKWCDTVDHNCDMCIWSGKNTPKLIKVLEALEPAGKTVELLLKD